MANASGKPPFRPMDQDVLINSPNPGDSVAVPLTGAVPVTGTFNSATCTAVFVKIYPSTATIPTSPPPNDNTVIRFDKTGGATSFSGNVPAAAAGMGIASAVDNQLVAWSQLTDSQGAKTFGSSETIKIKIYLQSTQGNVLVGAKACIWFAWTLEDLLSAGPSNLSGEAGDAYRPVPLIRPSDATSLTLTAVTDPPGSTWAHTDDGTDASGPEGISKAVKLENPAYQDPTLLSDHIIEMQADGSPVPPASSAPVVVRLNRLIGLWGTDHATPAVVIDIGPSRAFQAGDMIGGATRLFLAFHDGHQWTNNVGQVKVTAIWS